MLNDVLRGAGVAECRCRSAVTGVPHSHFLLQTDVSVNPSRIRQLQATFLQDSSLISILTITAAGDVIVK